MAAGVRVHDIGLALSPMAYFAQFELDVPAVAMVTASHNDNGWTGVKMGAQRPVTFGPEEMGRLKEIVLVRQIPPRGRRLLSLRRKFRRALSRRSRARREVHPQDEGRRRLRQWHRRRLRAADCWSGSAARWSRSTSSSDYTFPRYNPNPEDLEMLHAIADKVRETGADVGLGFDGDGDRCGVVDNNGDEIFADKIGVMLARDLSKIYPNARFVVDVKSTGLFATDPVLIARGVVADYWKTGHSYIKRRVSETQGARRLRESPGISSSTRRSGAAMTTGLLTAMHVLEMLDRNPDKVDGRALRRSAEDLGLADHVAALRRRDEIWRRRQGDGALPGHAGARRSHFSAARSATSSR